MTRKIRLVLAAAVTLLPARWALSGPPNQPDAVAAMGLDAAAIEEMSAEVCETAAKEGPLRDFELMKVVKAQIALEDLPGARRCLQKARELLASSDQAQAANKFRYYETIALTVRVGDVDAARSFAESRPADARETSPGCARPPTVGTPTPSTSSATRCATAGESRRTSPRRWPGTARRANRDMQPPS